MILNELLTQLNTFCKPRASGDDPTIGYGAVATEV